MKKYLLLIIICFSFKSYIFSQSIGIGTTTPNSNARLDVSSANQGILIPRMDSTHRKSIPNTIGMLVYDSTTKSFWYNNGALWETFISTINNFQGSPITQLGKIIYYNSNNGGEIWTANYDGSNQVKIPIVLDAGLQIADDDAHLSPDGQKIFFSVYGTTTTNSGIYSCDINGGNVTHLIDKPTSGKVILGGAY